MLAVLARIQSAAAVASVDWRAWITIVVAESGAAQMPLPFFYVSEQVYRHALRNTHLVPISEARRLISIWVIELCWMLVGTKSDSQRVLLS